MRLQIHFPDSEFAENFQAYLNYLEDLAGVIGGQYGWKESLVSGVHEAVLALPMISRIRRRSYVGGRTEALERLLRKAWGELRRLHREIEIPDEYDEEANAWLPVQAYYSVYNAIMAVAVASGQMVPKDHTAALHSAAEYVKRGKLPFPWSAYCEGCPQTGTVLFGGLRPSGEPVHVLSRPDPSTTDDRLAMFLRTTRERELARRFSEMRRKAIRGRSRRNLNRSVKEAVAEKVAATTVFDLFWRMRRKSNYDDADVFVLGAADALHAQRFGSSLAILADATIAALEGVMAGYVGPELLLSAVRGYAKRARSDPGRVLQRREESWASRVRAPAKV
jgi:hypothetical protein